MTGCSVVQYFYPSIAHQKSKATLCYEGGDRIRSCSYTQSRPPSTDGKALCHLLRPYTSPLYCSSHSRKQFDIGRPSTQVTRPGQAQRFTFHRPGSRIGVTEGHAQVKSGMDDTLIRGGNLIPIARTCLEIRRMKIPQLRSVARLALTKYIGISVFCWLIEIGTVDGRERRAVRFLLILQLRRLLEPRERCSDP